jgi:hypothetical protein
VRDLSETFADLASSLKFQNKEPNTEKFLLIERNFHNALSAYKKNCYENINRPANHHGHISEE